MHGMWYSAERIGSTVSVSRDEDFFDDDEEDIDFDSRELCPDGTCTGIIIDGRCSECGKAPGEIDAVEADSQEAETEAPKSEAETDANVKKNRCLRMQGMYELKIITRFAAAHQLRALKGGCENLHGHNWKVE